MKITPWTVAAIVMVAAAPVGRVAAEPDRQHAAREGKVERQDVDEAITAAQNSAKVMSDVLDAALEKTRKDGEKREKSIRSDMDDLVNALSRLREKFDANADWTDQRGEVRTAMLKWRGLDPILRKHWVSKTRDEFEALHRDVRKLARIYEVDSPSRT